MAWELTDTLTLCLALAVAALWWAYRRECRQHDALRRWVRARQHAEQTGRVVRIDPPEAA